MIAVYILTIFIGMLWAIRCVVERKVFFTKTRLDLPILLFLASQTLSYLFSIDPLTSLLGYYSRFNGGLISLFCYSFLYWAFVSNLDKSTLKPSINSLLLSSFLVGIYGILQHFGIDAHLWVQDVQTRIFSTLGQPNWLAAFVSAVIFIPIHKVISSKIVSFTNIILSVVLFLTLLWTKSRSGILAFGIAWGTYCLVSLIKKIPFRNLIVSNVLVISITLITTNPISEQIFKKTPVANSKVSEPALEVGGTESTAIRQIVWKGALNIWRDGPKNFWIGSGPETFAMAYYSHRPPEHNSTSEWELLYNKAHNEFLNYLATTGILGLGSYLILLTSIIRLLLPNLPLLAGWATVPITNFWGFSTVTLNLLSFLLPALQIVDNKKSSPPAHIPPLTFKRQFSIFFIIAFALILLYKTGAYWIADLNYSNGQKYYRSFLSSQNPEELWQAYEFLVSAHELNPHEPAINSELASIAAYMSILIEDRKLSAELTQTALSTSQRAIDISPLHPIYYKSRSRTLIILASLDEKYFSAADESLSQANKLSPTDPRIPYSRGIIAKYSNNSTKALDFFRQSLKLKPDFQEAIKQVQDISTQSATQK